MRIAFVITTLAVGGAENVLRKLLARLVDDDTEALVVSLTRQAPADPLAAHPKIRVESLGMTPSFPNPLATRRLVELLTEFKPDIVHTWMYHADLLGGIAARRAGVGPVVWGIHHSNIREGLQMRTKLVAKACAWLSRSIPAAIICCSNASRVTHARFGYDVDRMTVIPNGFDLTVFRPDPSARVALRKEWNIPDGTFVVGLAARFDPQKDHSNFIEAAKRLVADQNHVCFVLCGTDVSWDNKPLSERIAKRVWPIVSACCPVETTCPRDGGVRCRHLLVVLRSVPQRHW